MRVVHGEDLYFNDVFPGTFHGHDGVFKLVEGGDEAGVLEEPGCTPDQRNQKSQSSSSDVGDVGVVRIMHPAAS